MSSGLVIGVDCSTTACKAIAWDPDGRAVAEARCGYPTFHPKPAWNEQDAEDWWSGLCRALRELCGRTDPRRFRALCVTDQRESFVPVDRAGRPLRPAILWNDERAHAELPALRDLFGEKRLHTVTGKPLCLTPALPKMLWLLRHEPEAVRACGLFLEAHAFLVLRLTGQAVTSIACADPLGLVDMRAGSWSAELISGLGLREEQFPRLVPPGQVIGGISPEAAAATGLPAGLPVAAGAGDGQCAGLGVNATEEDQAYLILGTGVVSGTISREFRTHPAFRTLHAPLDGAFYLETVIRSGVYLVAWLVERFGVDLRGAGRPAEEALEEEAASVPPGSLGLLLVPYWQGAMNPYWDAAASGITVGWTGAHGRPHLFRAVMEGIAYEQRLAGEAVAEALGRPTREYLILGGGSRSRLWCTIMADVTGLPVTRIATEEATCLGAGMLAAAAAGWYPDARTAAAAMSRRAERIEPDPANGAIYDSIYREAYRPLFPAVRAISGKLAALNRG